VRYALEYQAPTHIEARYDIRTVQELLGHRDVATTMIYTRVLNRGGRGVESPADRLLAGGALRGITREPSGASRLTHHYAGPKNLDGAGDLE
jgi:hypothetical protein